MEPRARIGRHKETLNFSDDLRSLLYGTGAPVHPDITRPLSDGSSNTYLTNLPTPNTQHPPTPFANKTKSGTVAEPFPETLRVLDEIVTDYIIETGQQALQVASYAGRAKLKVEDFTFVLRRDTKKLGRVQEMFGRNKMIKDARKTTGVGEGGDAVVDLKKLQAKDLQNFGDLVGEEGSGKGKGKGRGRRRKRNIEDVDGDVNENMVGGQVVAVMSGGAANGDDLGDVDADLEDLDDEEPDRHRDKRTKSALDSL